MREARFFVEFTDVLDPLLLEPQHVKDYLLFLLNDDLRSPTTCKMILAVLRTFFSVGLGRPRALDAIPWPRVAWPLPDIWATAELEKLFSAIPDPRLRTLLLTTYATGMRISEACNLQVSDIDRARGVIHVRKGKGNKARLTPLPLRLLTHLEDYWRLVRPVRPYVFPGPRSGLPISNERAAAAMALAVSHSGVNKTATPHTLRHCFATHSLENGMDLHTLQKILGHASIRTTERYLHLSTQHISQAKSPFELLSLPTLKEMCS